jgi:GAF domain-containing protein
MIKPDLSQPPGNRLALLYQLTQTFNSSLNLDEVLNLVMDEVIKAMHTERGFVMLSESNGKLIFQVARGIDQQLIDQPQFQISRSVVERVAREGVSILTDDAQTDVRFSGRLSIMILGLRSILCAPLKLKDNFLGVIYIDNRLQAGIFNQSDLELLTAIAVNAAVAIENARLFRDAQDKLQTLPLLQEISADLTSTLDLERVLTACLRRVQETFNAEAASILTVEGDDLLFQIALGEKSSEIKPFRVQLGKGFAGWVVQNKQGTSGSDCYRNCSDIRKRSECFYRRVCTV